MVKVQFQKSQQNFRLLPHQATISEDVFISGSLTTNSLQLWRLLAQVLFLHLNLSSKILYSNSLINPVSPFNTCDDLILKLSYTRINTVVVEASRIGSIHFFSSISVNDKTFFSLPLHIYMQEKLFKVAGFFPLNRHSFAATTYNADMHAHSINFRVFENHTFVYMLCSSLSDTPTAWKW